jgi:hypothetical protein
MRLLRQEFVVPRRFHYSGISLMLSDSTARYCLITIFPWFASQSILIGCSFCAVPFWLAVPCCSVFFFSLPLIDTLITSSEFVEANGQSRGMFAGCLSYVIQWQ